MNLVKNGLKFEDIKQHLRKISNDDLLWELDQEQIYELIHGPQYSYCYIEIDYDKLSKLFANLTGYILWESICTDTAVGKKLFEYEGELTFSTAQYFRKGDKYLNIHNKEKYEKFRDELKKCMVEEVAEIEIEEFTTNRIIWVVDYIQSATRTVLFLGEDDIMYEIDKVNRKGHSLFDATVTYFDQEGYLREYSGDCKYRIIDSIFSDEEMLKRFKNKNAREFITTDSITSQTGE